MHRPSRPLLNRRRTAWLAAWCLLLAQALAVLHGGLHPGPDGPLRRAQQALAPQGEFTRLQQAVADHEHGSVVCRALDHLAHPAPPAAPLLPALVAAAPSPVSALPRGLLPRLAARPYLARAPPLHA